MRVALDSNILVYAEGINGVSRKQTAVSIVRRLPVSELVIPLQALGELFYVLVRKGGRTASRARDAVLAWQEMAHPVANSVASFSGAMDLVVSHHLTVWDAMILSAAAEGQCRILLSEDLHNGFTWRGVTVCNPFSSPLHPLLESLQTEAD